MRRNEAGAKTNRAVGETGICRVGRLVRRPGGLKRQMLK